MHGQFNVMNRSVNPKGRSGTLARVSLRWLVVGVLLLTSADRTVRADDVLANKPAVVVGPAAPWANLFAGQPTKFECVITSRQAGDATLFWSLSVARAVIARGEQPVALSPDKPSTPLLEFTVGDVREGLIVPAALQLEVRPRDGAPKFEPAKHTVSLHVFSPDATAHRDAWLKSLDIVLFDPAKRTAEAFERSRIPCRIADAPRCHELTSGLVIYGEGIEPARLDATWRAAIEAADLGRRVIVMSSPGVTVPTEGLIDSPTESLLSISLRRREIITELDKRLDAIEWPKPGRLVDSSLYTRSKGDVPHVEFRNEEDGWHWLDIRHRSGGRLVWLGFGVIESWEATPAARHLLLKVMEEVATDKPKGKSSIVEER